MTIPQSSQNIIQLWQRIPQSYSEKDLELNFIQKMFEALGLPSINIKADVHLGLGAGLKADRLIYTDLGIPPALVVEVKKRIPSLANAGTYNDFRELCHKPNSLYREAVGYPDKAKNNGVRQYLDKSNPHIAPNCLASYGLVINGDFFQIWRRVEGLVLPLTPIQRITERSIPQLMQQLKYCLKTPKRALVTTIWNRKGGVAKTTNTLNVGAVLALHNKKVLLIDLDSQTDLTEAFKIDPKAHEKYLEVCFTKIQAAKPDEAKELLKSHIQSCPFKTSDKQLFSLDILPGEKRTLDRIKEDTTTYGSGDKVKIFRKLIELLAADYDYIFIDSSPAGDDLTKAMLYGCDTIAIASDYSKKTLRHSVHLYQRDSVNIRQEREKQNKLYTGPWNLGVLFSNCPPDTIGYPADDKPNSQLEKCIQEELESKQFQGKQCKTRLPNYAQTKLAEYKHRPVICWQKSPITRQYQKLVNEIFLNHYFVDD